MKKSTPALSHQPPKGIDGEKYESLAGLIEPYADGQFAELLEGLCERVIEAFSPHSWDELTPFQRRSLARLDDVQHDPSLRIDLAAGFHEADYELNHVQAWLTMGAVTPRNATLLFFGQNPSKSQSNVPDMGVDFDLMELSFEDAARDGHVRSLNDWLILARSRNLNAVGLDGWEACATIAARATESAPAQTATPVPVPVFDWKNTVRSEAWEKWVQTLAENGTPTLENVSKHLAYWCATKNIKTSIGKSPKASYLKTHVIDSQHWSPPRNMTREAAKKHLEQKEQAKQAN